MIKHALTALTLTLSPLSAQAGDPCPIQVNIHDLGAPAWLDREALLADLQSKSSWFGFRHHPHANGIEVNRLHAGGPMEASGLEIGDVITRINALPTTDSTQLKTFFDSAKPGDKVVMQTLMGPQYSVTVGASDPVAFGFIRALETQDCRNPAFFRADPATQADLQPYFYDANRRFRCDDAHIGLQELSERWEADDVYVLRGSRRIIIAMPYWGTTCIQASELDGTNLSTAKLITVIERVIGDYIDDRHENP